MYASLAAGFDAAVRSRPDAVAVVHENERLTYSELEWRTAVLAGRIMEATEPGSLVGVCLPTGVDAVAGIVATVRAGCAYVPLDPAYPAERLRYLVEDAQLDVVIVDRETRSLAGRYATTIDVNAGGDRPAVLPDQTADAPAYVIYTSGSTGRPKGVMVPHGSVTALLRAGKRRFSFDADDVWSLFHSISFDFSVWEIWGALLHGARLVIVDDEAKTAPARLAALLDAERVTVFNVVPSVFREIATVFAERPRPSSVPRYVIFGGEPVHLPSVSAFRAACDPPPVFVNMYGITETTVLSTGHVITVEDERAGRTKVIGVPLDHQRIRLMDEAMTPVPPGAVGEICVAGDGLAIGYLHRPELTAERFVWADDDGEKRRFYRSGDLARWGEGGELEYVGRADTQVKIHGFRIELGEVEACLEAMPAVEAAAVAVERNRAGESVLVGYFVPKSAGEHGEARQLRAALRDMLPRHMVPGLLVPVPALPRTVSGKLDRARLGELRRTTA